MIGRVIVAALLAALVLPAAAQADWSGDYKGDVVGVGSDGRLLLYAGDGAGHFAGPGKGIGAGWNRFDLVFTPGDFSGDGRIDLLARQPDGGLFMYRGNGKGGFVTGADEKIGSGWQSFTALVGNGDWNGDGHADILARTSDGVLYLYRGDGDSGFITGQREQIGTGWQGFTALLAAGDWSGDGKPDLLARTSAGALLLYRGTGTGGFQTGNQQIGSGWQGFTALFSRRRLQRRRQAGHPGPELRRRAAHVPRQRDRRVRHRPGGADRDRLELAQQPDADLRRSAAAARAPAGTTRRPGPGRAGPSPGRDPVHAARRAPQGRPQGPPP